MVRNYNKELLLMIYFQLIKIMKRQNTKWCEIIIKNYNNDILSAYQDYEETKHLKETYI